MEDVILQTVVASLMVLTPLFAIKRRKRPIKLYQSRREYSNYVVNEYGKLELITHKGEQQN